jgi:DNA-binding beta-propeller fold protein YncE
VSVINGARCNARTFTGCRPTAVVATGPWTAFVATDPVLHTAFSISQADDTLSEISTRVCNGRITSGCPAVARTEHATFNPRHGYNPNAFALIPRTSTAYLANAGGAGIVSVVSIARCNATHTSGCRGLPPSVPDHELFMAADPATGTIYAGNVSQARIDVIDGATCNAARHGGCRPVAEIPVPGPAPAVGAIDDATHTLYVGDFPASTVSVINTSTCNATHTGGCAVTPPTVTVGKLPGPPAYDKANRTLYVAVGRAGNRVAVVNAATCNAADTSGCGQTPATIPVPKGTAFLGVSNATDTVYAVADGRPFFTGHTVAVINGAACNGTDHSGCAHPAATVNVGFGPVGIGVNDRAHTVYVANNADGLAPGTVSMINVAACNGTHTAGCHRRVPAVTVGRSPLTVMVNARTDTIYVADFSSADMSVINGARCNATVTGGCRRAVRDQPVGSQPGEGASGTIDPATATIYMPLLFPFPNGPMALVKIKR